MAEPRSLSPRNAPTLASFDGDPKPSGSTDSCGILCTAACHCASDGPMVTPCTATLRIRHLCNLAEGWSCCPCSITIVLSREAVPFKGGGSWRRRRRRQENALQTVRRSSSTLSITPTRNGDS